MKKVASVFNISTTMNFTTIDAIYDTLMVDRFLGRPIPKEIT